MSIQRTLQISLFCLALLPSVSKAQEIAAADAKDHIGEKATVCGKVASERTATASKGQPTFINLDAPYPNQVFTILIWGEDRTKVGTLPSSGSRVCASGTIESYRGIPEIVVKSRSQLKE